MKPWTRRAKAAAGSPSSSTARRSSRATRARARARSARWIIENDWLEAIVALPDQLFYNTGISHLRLDRDQPEAQGAARARCSSSTGRAVPEDAEVPRATSATSSARSTSRPSPRLYGDVRHERHLQVFDNQDFGFRRITVERPLRLNFQASPERIERLQEESGFAGLAKSKKKGAPGEREVEQGRELQEQIVAALRTLSPTQVVKSRDAFDKTASRCVQEGEARCADAGLQVGDVSALRARRKR